MHVYIIYSESLNSFYTGYNKENLEERILHHQTGFYNNSYTTKAKDWVLVWCLECQNVAQALKIEKHIKKMKSKIYIQNLISQPSKTLKPTPVEELL
jgi:putative endonuclease